MLSQMHVLYVEDDAQSRVVMQLLLKRLQVAQMTILENSAHFAEQMEQLTALPNLIFLDIHVKPLDGFQMLALLRSLPRFQTVPIVALTASVMNEEVYQLRVAGFDGCLAKPLDLQIFPETLQRLLQGEKVWRIQERGDEA
jgi:CheY-like chemotaxis protein